MKENHINKSDSQLLATLPPQQQFSLKSGFNTALFEQYPDAIFTLDKEGKFLSMSHNSEEFIGYRPDELTGTFNQLIKEEDLAKVLTHFQLALYGEPQNYNCEVIHKNGYYVHLNITNIPITINGDICGVYGLAKNITKINQKEAELLKITNSLHLAQEVAKIGSWDCDSESNKIYCSDPLYSILGIEKQDHVVPSYENLLSMIHPDDRELFDYHFQLTKQTGTKMDLEYRVQKPDQSFITVHVVAVGKKDSQNKVTRVIGVLYDISESITTKNRLKESEETFKTIANNLDVGIWSQDLVKNQLIYASPAIDKVTGYKVEEFLSGRKHWNDIIHKDDLEYYLELQKKLMDGEMFHHHYRIIDANSGVKWVEDKTFPQLNSEGQLVRVDGIVQDVSERKRNEDKVNIFAYHDYLTELPNRRMFDQKLEHLISDYQMRNEKFALLYLDMDRFKFVNDTLGHEIGDALLCQISDRLSSITDNHSVFRVGGDEFTIIQQNLDTINPLELGKQVIAEIEKPFLIDGYEIHITTSIGIGIFPDDGDTLKKLKMNSDAALYRAKEIGKNNAQLFTKGLNSEAYKLFTLESDLRKAIQREEFILHYQPRVDTLTRKMVGAEALIRWNHPISGAVSPGEFIPLAEETGYIKELSDWVIQQVCKQLNKWKVNGYQLIPISINLSAKTLMKADLVQGIMNNLTHYAIPPSLIEIEITEDTLIKNEGAALPTIQLLRDMGISIAIDDFGTGYSSFGYLKKFKADYIKIDRSFIKDITENKEDATIVQSIILLAKGFNLKIVAEGVETQKQWELLQKLNCHYIQGYLFSKPLPSHQFSVMLRKNVLT